VTQFSLKSLLAAIAFASIGLAGLTHPNRELNFIVVSLALAVTGLFTLHALCSRRPSPPFSVGFALAGWIYLLLICNRLEYSLVTTRALEALYPLLNPQPDTNMTHFGVFFTNNGGFPLLTKYSNYLHIGHALWMLIVGYLGGLVAAWFASRRRSER